MNGNPGQNAAQLSRDFWSGTDLTHTFPRPVARAVGLKLPLTVVQLPAVAVEPVRRWLERIGLIPPFPEDRRDLMGCLFAHRGIGFAFVCAADPEDEQRLTLAHEVAHFLCDYLLPRRRMIAALGRRAADVLDGSRPATVPERAAALLAHVRLGPHVHLLPRPGADEETDARLILAEARADALALELVAPRERIAERLWRYPGWPRGDGSDVSTEPEAGVRAAAVATDLAGYFGLPAHVFQPIVRAALRPRRAAFLIDARAAARHAIRGESGESEQQP